MEALDSTEMCSPADTDASNSSGPHGQYCPEITDTAFDNIEETMEPQMNPLGWSRDVLSSYGTPSSQTKYRRRFSVRPFSEDDQDVFQQHKIPDQIIHDVLSYLNFRDLSAAMGASTRFYRIGQGGNLWRGVDMGSRTVDALAVAKVVERGAKALRLCGTTIRNSDDEMCPLNCRHLLYLDATRIRYDDITTQSGFLDRLLLSSNKLTCLSLSSCHLSPSLITALSSLTQLEQLDLSMSTGLYGDSIRKALHNCSKRLVQLNMSGSKIGKDGAIAVACMCINLERVDLSGNATDDNSEDCVDDQVAEYLVRYCVQLKEVHLSDSHRITDRGFKLLLELANLETLSLSRCYSIHPVEFLEARNLHTLSVFGCVTHHGADALKKSLPYTRINEAQCAISMVARATPPPSVTSIWGQRTKSHY